MTVQHVSICSPGTGVVARGVISGSPRQHRRLIVTLESNGETVGLAGTWTENRKIKLLELTLL